MIIYVSYCDPGVVKGRVRDSISFDKFSFPDQGSILFGLPVTASDKKKKKIEWSSALQDTWSWYVKITTKCFLYAWWWTHIWMQVLLS